ncbi:MAG: putative metallopeptidase [Thermofilaceae archaeon]
MTKVEYKRSLHIEHLINTVADALGFSWVKKGYVRAVESRGSKGRAVARIYGLPKVFQEAYGLPPMYVVEVISEKFYKLTSEDKVKVLIHELLHVPHTFSGALRSHGEHTSSKRVEELYRILIGKGTLLRDAEI